MQATEETGPRRVIAVITDAFAPFHRDVLENIWPHFNAAGYGTLGVAGRDVRTDRLLEADVGQHRPYQGAFGTQLDVQGAVIVCGATHPSLSREALHNYVAELTEGPVVSLGIRLPGIPSVEIDWPTGIEALMEHALNLPGERRLAFVTGFPGDPHSEMREAGFRKAMSNAGVEVDERLVVCGNFAVADARRAVAGLLASGVPFDGLIAANDDMAVGAIAALTANGLSVPQDVFVAGFDDAVHSMTSHPPLTTVSLETSVLAEATANLVLDAIGSAEPIPSDTVVSLDCDLVIRESTSGLDAGVSSGERELARRWKHSRAPKGLDIEGLAVAAIAALRSGDRSFFSWFTELCVSASISSSPEYVIWLRHAWRELHGVVLVDPEIVPTGQRRAMLEQVAIIDRQLHHTEAQHQTERRVHQQLQERLVMRIASCSDTAALWETLRIGLRSLGMLNAWVVAHENLAEENEPGEKMDLLFSLESDDLEGVSSFEARAILPGHLGGMLEQDMHVLVPLRAGDTDIGYMVVEPRGEYLLEVEAIASGVAQVLRHVRQVADLEGQTARLHVMNAALDRLAGHDALTGLANRKLFLSRLEQHVADLGSDESLSVVFLDLDGFKQINDTLGHGAGDELLRVIAGRLSRVVSDTDTLARLGGDEFTIIVHDDTNPKRVLEVAQRALEAAAESASIAGQDVSVSASLGIASCPRDGRTADDLMRNADVAMYAAKDAGRNRVEVYEERRDDGSRAITVC